jgi:large subunit ribosomal protein L5
MAYEPRLREKYRKEIIPALMEKFKYKNIMQVPRLEKIVINMGVGEATQNVKELEVAMKELAQITGQWPVIKRAKKSISNFRVRKGQPIACMVTLRGARMYEFLDRFISLALPRVRDFRGLNPRSFDGRGNYTVGVKDQLIFPEIDYTKVEKTRGMNITFVTTAETDEEAYELLRLFGMPFRR